MSPVPERSITKQRIRRSEWYRDRFTIKKFQVLTIMYIVYVLFSHKDKNLYIGFTTNLTNRLKDHNLGRNKSTKPRRPFTLIFYEAYFSKRDAERRERYFKTAKGKTTLKQMIRESLKDVSDN